ncbi:putative helicase [Rhodococcus cercidiphylli]|nr:putative helicase [Rhodococcus cercidiphylli]
MNESTVAPGLVERSPVVCHVLHRLLIVTVHTVLLGFATMATSPSRQAVDELFGRVFLDRVVSSPRFDLNPTSLKQFDVFRVEFDRSEPIEFDEEISKSVHLETWAQWHTTKLKFSRGTERSAIRFNEHCTVSGIPVMAHTVRIGQLTPIEWVLDRCQLTHDPHSGRILFDPNEVGRRHGRPRVLVDFLATTIAASVACLG